MILVQKRKTNTMNQMIFLVQENHLQHRFVKETKEGEDDNK